MSVKYHLCWHPGIHEKKVSILLSNMENACSAYYDQGFWEAGDCMGCLQRHVFSLSPPGVRNGGPRLESPKCGVLRVVLYECLCISKK